MCNTNFVTLLDIDLSILEEFNSNFRVLLRGRGNSIVPLIIF